MAPKIVFERRNAKVKDWDDQLTPLEIATVLETDAKLPFTIAPLLKSGQNPVGYVREAWSEDASYYTSRKGAKRLIVAFTGTRQRLGIPISCFLQSLRDDVFDVVVLRDPGELHYTHGIRGLGGFLETMRRIEDFAGRKRLSADHHIRQQRRGTSGLASWPTFEGAPCHKRWGPLRLASRQADAKRNAGLRIRFALRLRFSQRHGARRRLRTG